MINVGDLDYVINKTIKSVEQSKNELYSIGKSARSEYECIMLELLAVKEELAGVIREVDDIEVQYNKARIRLMEVNRDFKSYSEEEIKDAYDKAQKKQVELLNRREQEKTLRFKRDHLERSLRAFEDTIKRSDELVSNVGIALKVLKNDLESTSMQISEIQQRQALGISIIRAQEEERLRLAREIHDGPAQSMANIVMRTEFCLKLLEKEPLRAPGEFRSLMDLVRRSLEDVRKIIFDLRPMELDDLGLISALKRYVEQYSKETNILVETSVSGMEYRLDSTLEVAIFRVIQESLTNIKKHAKARHAVINIEFLDDRVNVAIRDNGCGFTEDDVIPGMHNEGYGLMGMRERMQLLNGKLEIKSSPGQGTEINLSVPVKNGEPKKNELGDVI